MNLPSFRHAVPALLALLFAGCATNQGSTFAPVRSLVAAPASAPSATGDILYVSNFGPVAAYDSVSGALLNTIASSVRFPGPLAFDVSGNLFVGNSSGGRHDRGTVKEYVAGGSAVMRAIRSGIDDPFSIALDPAGNLYVANQFANAVTVYAPHSKRPARRITSGVSVPVAVILDSLGNLYVANTSVSGGTGSVTEYAAGGKTPVRTITKGVNLPLSLAVDTQGNLYVGNYAGKSVTVYAPGSTSPSRTIDRGKVPTAMKFDRNGNLYVAAYGHQGVDEFAPLGNTPIRTITEGIDHPQALAIDSADRLAVANHGTMYEPGSVTIYGSTGTAPVLKIVDGVVSPIAVAFAPTISINP